LDGLSTEDFGIFYGHLAYFMAIWYILWPFGIFYGHLVYFMAIWYILWQLGIFFPVLECCTLKNLATVLSLPTHSHSVSKGGNLNRFFGH
jgi:hypothetical protein